MTLEQHSLRIRKAIGDILLHDWDPIGVRDDPMAQDEYETYIPAVYRLLVNRVSIAEIADYLFRVETVLMGMTPLNRNMLHHVAEKLLHLDSVSFTKGDK